jgi:hypothetical protein
MRGQVIVSLMKLMAGLLYILALANMNPMIGVILAQREHRMVSELICFVKLLRSQGLLAMGTAQLERLIRRP